MSRLLRVLGAATALIIAMILLQAAAETESAWAVVLVFGVWFSALAGVQLIVSAARAADETLLRRYVAYRDELDRTDGRAES